MPGNIYDRTLNGQTVNDKVLSMRDLEEMDGYIADFNGAVIKFYTKFDELLRLFNNEAVVQSFYDSGFLGESQKERLIFLRKTVETYADSLVDGPNALINVIKKFIREQKDLVSKAERGYSISESVAQRREGNRG